MRKLLLTVLLMLVASLSVAQPFVSSGGGGGLTQADIDSAVSEALGNVIYHHPWMLISASGTLSPDDYHVGGWYNFGASADDFNGAITFGTPGASAPAHFMVVAAAGATDTEVTITGASITDTKILTLGDSETLLLTDAAEGAYSETSKKWLGEVTITKTAGTARLCNYGFCKYWDNSNQDFTIVGGETLWEANASGAIDIRMYHHKATGWTYNAGAEPTPPDPLFSLATVHSGAYDNTVAGEEGGIKITTDNGGTLVLGGQREGVVVIITTSVNNQLNYGQIVMDFKNVMGQ